LRIALLWAVALPAYAQTPPAPSADTLDDPRVNVSGENPVYGKRRIFASYDRRDLPQGETLNRVRLRMLQPFGPDLRYSWQIELPYERLDEADGDVVYGLSDIATRINWTFYRTPELRQNLGLSVQWQTAQDSRLSDNATLLQPQYAFSYAHSETLVISGQLTYARSVDRDRGAPVVNRLAFEPSATVLLPDSWSCTLATRLSWNFDREKLAATIRGTLGFVLGQRNQWELDMSVERALTELARQTQFENRIGIDLVRYF
jgi:Putative MetA-pathway of phenol degradation